MTEHLDLLDDPGFQALLRERSRWRWGLCSFLIGIYLVYALGGLYFAEAYASPIGDSSVPWGIVAGISLIILSFVLSLVYIHRVNSLKDFTPGREQAAQVEMAGQ